MKTIHIKTNRIKRTTGLIITLIMLMILSIGCKKNVSDEVYETKDIEANQVEKTIVMNEEVVEKAEISGHPKVQIEMEDGKIMVFELYPEYAPETVANFISLVESGFYDGLKFHRIIKGFMVQSGDPLGNGTGGSETTIKGEFSDNGFDQNTLKHEKGVLSMARSRDMNSASSQFFIMDGESKNLDGSYAAFGKLIEGEKTLDTIANTEVKPNQQTGEVSVPTVDVIIKSITVVTMN